MKVDGIRIMENLIECVREHDKDLAQHFDRWLGEYIKIIRSEFVTHPELIKAYGKGFEDMIDEKMRRDIADQLIDTLPKYQKPSGESKLIYTTCQIILMRPGGETK